MRRMKTGGRWGRKVEADEFCKAKVSILAMAA